MSFFLRVSHCNSTKEMWNTLQFTHKGTIEMKTSRVNTLTHKYELFRMKSEEKYQDMEKWFIRIDNHLRAMGKSLQNEDLIDKVLRCLNTS